MAQLSGGIVSCAVIVAMATGHALAEASAFDRAAGVRGQATLAGSRPDRVWLASCLAFLAFEVFAAWRALDGGLIETGTLRLLIAAFGIAAALAGIRLRCLAIAALGPGFGEPPFGRPPASLARDGLFAVVRHPSELGLLLFTLGLTCLAGDRATAVAWCVAILPLSLWRIRREERWLAACVDRRHDAYVAMAVPLLCPRARDGRRLLRQMMRGSRAAR